jgi:hypothetical protein
MATTTPLGIPPVLPPTGRRTGATLVAATGAFLLVAAAAVFTAVQWHALDQTQKLGVLVAITAAFLVGGLSARRALPATGSVLAHVGAFLLPVDVAALGVSLGLGWRGHLALESTTGLVLALGLAAAWDSVVLAWAAVAAGVAAATSLATATGVPAGLTLAVAAAGALLATEIQARRSGAGHGATGPWVGAGRRLATAWALVAGLGPVLAAAAPLVGRVAGSHLGRGVLTESGWQGRVAGRFAIVTGLMAAAVLAWEAHRREHAPLAAAALVAFILGLGGTAMAVQTGPAATLVAAAAIAVVAEAGAALLWADPFWGRPAVAGAAVVEVGTGLAALAVAPLLLLLTVSRPAADPVAGAAAGLAALAWALASFRAQGRFLGQVATVPFAVLAVGAVALAFPHPAAVAAAGVGLALLLLVARAPLGRSVAATLVPVAVLWSTGVPLVTVLVSGAGAAGLVVAARWRATEGDPDADLGALGLAAVAAVTALGTMAGVVIWPTTPALLLVVGILGLVGVALDLGTTRRVGRLTLGDPARLALALFAVGTLAARPGDALPAAVLATALLAADAAWRSVVSPAIAAAVCVQAVILETARAGGLSWPRAGVALCVAAFVWAGLAALVGTVDESMRRWRLPLLVAAVAGAGMGLQLSLLQPSALADALMVVGAIGLAAGLTLDQGDMTAAGATAVALGGGLRLALAHVTVVEPYAAIAAAGLLGAGVWARSRAAAGRRPPVSSWLAYAPAVALLGGLALAARMAGGTAGHAAVAGLVAGAAVAVGGARRLAGPLATGIVILVAVTSREALHATTLPTWGWLAGGGAILLAVGVALDRADTSPTEAGRRLVDVVAERFS